MLGLVLSAPGILRSFQYVSYGESAPAGVVSLSCDGKVPGTDLDLTHWTSNDTPDALYADTSTEIALKLARARLNSGEYAEYDDAMVVNNHYDTDGVLSVFACTNPEEALAHYELMTAGAEAGDFGEWSSDLGVQLDYALSALCTDDEDEGYAAALARVPALLEDFESDSAGAAHAALWRDDWEWLVAAWDAFESGSAPQTLSEGVGRIMLVEQPKGSSAIDCTVLHRALRERGVCGHACSGKACSRVLKATHDAEAGLWRYVYEKPGHGWVQKLVERETVPLADPAKIAAALSALLGGRGGEDEAASAPMAAATAVWQAGGASGLSGQKIGWTSTWVEAPPQEVMRALVEVDEGARAAASD